MGPWGRGWQALDGQTVGLAVAAIIRTDRWPFVLCFAV